MSVSNSFSHLTLEERRIILTGITNGSTKTAIAQTIGKDKSTVGKEIKLHRALTHKCKMPLECNNYRKCVFGRQYTADCPEYNPFHCSRRDRSPGACNGCSNWSHCRFDKYQYYPEDAQMDNRATLVNSRQGVNFTFQEAKAMADITGPLLRQGQSPTRLSPIIRNLASLRKRSTTISKEMCSMRSQILPLWTFAVKYLGRYQKRNLRGTKSGKTADNCRAVPIRNISSISRSTRMSSLHKWAPFTMMKQIGHSCRPSNL